ncbi:hypothetical protein BDP27DRAFT_1423724 [Rhodocollybia butyracea]|uniref:Uncharacterized protein n=1 Tax=Rhodocollybia butyracea TaxID=206335 RepID=A0A9P5PNX2_9AGAR|nr:hypothetical protein BDP27DRAFT_1423724 [Rhodocollybia butyracea]
MFGRHFDDKDEVLSHITRQSIDVLKSSFRADVSNEEWWLIKALKLIRSLPLGDSIPHSVSKWAAILGVLSPLLAAIQYIAKSSIPFQHEIVGALSVPVMFIQIHILKRRQWGTVFVPLAVLVATGVGIGVMGISVSPPPTGKPPAPIAE